MYPANITRAETASRAELITTGAYRLVIDLSGRDADGRPLDDPEATFTTTSEITQRTAALWKMDDFDDGLYIFGLGLAANITAGTQLKAELLDTFKNKPPTADVKKNDVAILLSFVYKY